MTSDLMSALPEAEESLREAVYIAVGAASVTWNEQANGTDVFDDVRAREVAEDLLMRVKVITRLGEAHLGLATTKELRDELASRDQSGPPSSTDDYRTLDPGKPLWHLVEEPWVGKESLWQHRDFDSVFSTDRGKTWYNLNDPLDFEGNPKIYATGDTRA